MFLPRVDGEHELYAQIRDDSRRSDAKRQLELFWSQFQNLAPQNFRKELQRQFCQRWWEMSLSVGLLNLGFVIDISPTDNKRPDIKIDRSTTGNIWIEAIAPKPGETEDALPPMKFGTTKCPAIADVPDNQFLLRLTSATKVKSEKYKEYLEDNIVGVNDILIIAVSACDLDEYDFEMDHPVPAPLKVLYGAGPECLTRNGSYIKKRSPLRKFSGGIIETNIFECSESDHISAVIYSNAKILNCPDNPAEKMIAIINPNAKNPVPLSLFSGLEQWTCETVLRRTLPSKPYNPTV